MIGGCLTGLCAVFALTGFTACKQAFTMKEYAVSDAFENIAIDTKTADVDFVLATDGVCKVVVSEKSGLQYSVSVQDNTLTVKFEDTRKWYQHLTFNTETPNVTVYLPDVEYKTLTIDATTGDMNIPKGLHFENVAIDMTTGDIECEALVSGNMKIEVTTGDIEVKNAQAGDIVIKVTTGDVEFEDVICANLSAQGSTGSFTADNAQVTKAFYVKCTTGEVSMEKIAAGTLTVDKTTGKMDISSATCGDVQLSTTTGSTTISGMTCADFTSTGSTGDLTMESVVASGKFTIDRSTGDITFNGCDAAEIEVEATSGDVTGTLLSEKIFIARSTSGRVNTPETLTGGKCKITTTSGDIKLEIKNN